MVVPIAPLHAQDQQAVAKPPSYAGRVLTPDGKPATRAEVILLDLTHPGDRQQIAATRADDDGTFAFHDVKSPTQAPRLTFVARAPGLAPTASSVFPGADAENEFALSPASTVRVTFLDPDGKPVPNLRVTPICGYSRRSLMRASAVWNCQSIFLLRRFRSVAAASPVPFRAQEAAHASPPAAALASHLSLFNPARPSASDW
jgi:hypothetical protein